ncbi:DUF6875 domain-containing protein [Nitrospirillum iridis]|uniref:DUF6875 domain-containing protein n=1 Tax=Nitrospirillum iridis TaxID=765888 RepID=A0A7X0EF38_9PROT|nr:hypothetical protein [Nitrospirillum iridis]MBB6254533.1 hypothetical protein [Nitrospirillum iridis]
MTTSGNLRSLSEILELSAATLGDPPDHAEGSLLKCVARWARAYLCEPHAELGRTGPVCPWSPTSMEFDLFMMTELPCDGMSDAQIEQDILALIPRFQAIPLRKPSQSQFRTIVAVLHGLTPNERVAKLHSALKPAFLDAGLMLGEFYDSCDKRGIRNSAFRPLRSPVPLLVIREMLEVDLAFLSDDVRFIRAYLKAHPKQGHIMIQQTLSGTAQLPLPPEQREILQAFLAEAEQRPHRGAK